MATFQKHIARGEKLTLQLTEWGRLGDAMASHDGQDVFVFGGIPGERVVAEVVGTRRKYVAARVVEVLEPSPYRIEPPCPYFGACTGCQWQHIAYERQLEMKREAVVDALERIGGLDGAIVAETLASPEPALQVEAHLLDFNGELYGQALEIELVERLRDEQRFGSTDELATQISRDIERARTLF